MIAVLAYHKIGFPGPGGWDTCHYVPLGVFREQLEWLVSAGWRAICAQQLLDALVAPDRLPPRSVLITFDDAHVSLLEAARPVLAELDLPAVCFAPTAFVGGWNDFDDGVEPRERVLDWAELRELEDGGVSVQSHGVSHRWLSLFDEQARASELADSRRTLEDRLGKRVELFAYPYGDACLDTGGIDAELERAGYRAAFLCGGGPSVETLPHASPLRFNRLAIYRDTDLERELGRRTVGS